MKILILHNKLPYPPKDGGAIAVWNFALELAKKNHNVFLLVINTSKHYFPPQNIPNINNNLKIFTTYLNTDIKPLKLLINLFFSKKPFHFVRFYSKKYKEKLIELISSENFDYVLYEGLYILQYIDIVKQYSNAINVYRAHNLEHEIWTRLYINETNFLKKIYFKNLAKRIFRYEKIYLKKIDILITLTKRDETEIKKKFNYTKPSFVSQIGVEVSNENTINYNEIVFPSVFFIGSLDWLPNQEGLLWFLRNIWNDFTLLYPDIKFEIAGRNAPYWLEKKIKSFNNVIFYGEVENAKEFIKPRAIMIVPILSGSGMRIKIIEGMSMGKCIITTSIGAEGIPVTNNYNIFIADTAKKFKENLIKLISDKHLFLQISRNAFEFIKENYNNEKIVEETLKYFSSIKRQ
ncbi:MAG: glycosyltransferase family 4 protein [Bacteroidales bacterium]|nr:glycosyltransferase family 4 protein [Bacteroidales bacterium]